MKTINLILWAVWVMRDFIMRCFLLVVLLHAVTPLSWQDSFIALVIFLLAHDIWGGRHGD